MNIFDYENSDPLPLFSKEMWDELMHSLGCDNMNMDRKRPYTGQSHTDTGERGKTEIKGITFRDLRDCFIRAVVLAGNDQNEELYQEAVLGEHALICENDLYKFDLSKIGVMAIFQNLSCEVEKIMGIFPNIPKLISEDDQDEIHG